MEAGRLSFFPHLKVILMTNPSLLPPLTENPLGTSHSVNEQVADRTGTELCDVQIRGFGAMPTEMFGRGVDVNHPDVEAALIEFNRDLGDR